MVDRNPYEIATAELHRIQILMTRIEGSSRSKQTEYRRNGVALFEIPLSEGTEGQLQIAALVRV